jgi:heterodisulfide reductase subunit C
MGAEMALPPHDIMRLTIANDRERLFNDDSLWLCLTCETCSARCPNDVDPARVIDALRELAAGEGAEHAPRNIRAFHESFLEQIRSTGRLSEVGLIMQYKLRSGALLQDVAVAPAMLRRGKRPLRPQRIAGVGEVKALMAACERERGARAAPAAGGAAAPGAGATGGHHNGEDAR